MEKPWGPWPRGGGPGPDNAMLWPWPHATAWSVQQKALRSTFPQSVAAVATRASAADSSVVAPWCTERGATGAMTARAAPAEGAVDPVTLPAAGAAHAPAQRLKRQYPGSPRTASAVESVVFGGDLTLPPGQVPREEDIEELYAGYVGRPSWQTHAEGLRTSFELAGGAPGVEAAAPATRSLPLLPVPGRVKHHRSRHAWLQSSPPRRGGLSSAKAAALALLGVRKVPGKASQAGPPPEKPLLALLPSA